MQTIYPSMQSGGAIRTTTKNMNNYEEQRFYVIAVLMLIQSHRAIPYVLQQS